MRKFIAELRVIITIAIAFGGYLPAQAEPEAKYPIVLTDVNGLREAGIAFNWGPWEVKPFEKHCYYYGGGGYLLSVSDQTLANYEAKGFSLQSLCTGLVSEARFDPETGGRLPTYIVVNEHEFKRTFNGKDVSKLSKEQLGWLEPGVVSDELPLALPPCFKGGQPYADCTWKYDIKTGKRLSEAETESYSAIGTALSGAIAAQSGWVVCIGPSENEDKCLRDTMGDTKDKEMELVALYLAAEGYWITGLVSGDNGQKPSADGLSPSDIVLSKASFFDISPNLPSGFVYALNADGAAGPSPSAATIVAASDGVGLGRKLSAKKLKELIEN